jgi:hypothetical protein
MATSWQGQGLTLDDVGGSFGVSFSWSGPAVGDETKGIT